MNRKSGTTWSRTSLKKIVGVRLGVVTRLKQGLGRGRMRFALYLSYRRMEEGECDSPYIFHIEEWKRANAIRPNEIKSLSAKLMGFFCGEEGIRTLDKL